MLLTAWGLWTPGPSYSTCSSSGKVPPTMGPTCDGYAHVINLIKLRQETKETEPRHMLLFCLIFFLDRSQNYESNGTSFIIFGAMNREI
jgi:hypothetical protein